MELAWHHSLAKYTATALKVLTVAVGFVFLLALFGDHYRGHAPMGAIVLSLGLLFVIFLLVHAIEAYATSASMQTVAGGAMLNSIITYSSALLLFGGLSLLGALIGDADRGEMEKALLYLLPGVFGFLFWFFGRRS